MARIPVGENDRRALNDAVDLAYETWDADDRRFMRMVALRDRVVAAMRTENERDTDRVRRVRRERATEGESNPTPHTIVDEDGNYITSETVSYRVLSTGDLYTVFRDIYPTVESFAAATGRTVNELREEEQDA